MIRKSLKQIVEDLSELNTGIIYISIKDNRFAYTNKYVNNSILIAVINKRTNNKEQLYKDLLENFNRVTIQDKNIYSDNYFTTAKLNNNMLNIKYNTKHHEWCSVSKVEVLNGK